LGHLWIVELTHIYIFAFKFTLRYLQSDINPIVWHRCRWHRWQICRRYRWHRWQICHRYQQHGETGGKICRWCRWYRWQICHRCRWYRCCTLTREYGISANFRKNSNWNTLGLGGNWFMKKTRSKKSRDTVPLSTETTVKHWETLRIYCGWHKGCRSNMYS